MNEPIDEPINEPMEVASSPETFASRWGQTLFFTGLVGVWVALQIWVFPPSANRS